MSEDLQTIELIGLLSDGQFHSGEELGRLLSISRAAIWKRLEKLKELGLAYESVRGKGYRLLSKIDLLSKKDILSELNGQGDVHLSIKGIVDSTNAEILRRLMRSDIKQGELVLAEMQTKGRGRRGRNWLSPYAANINMSMYWRFEQGVTAIDGLSLVVGLATLHVLREYSPNIALKWPNDILYGEQKLGGILLELNGDPNGVCHIVIGIGLNVNIQNKGYLMEVDQPWTSLNQITGSTHNRNTLLAKIINTLHIYLNSFAGKGFSVFQKEWHECDALLGKEVFIQLGEKLIFGTAMGVTETGELKLRTGAGVELFSGGEVSLRKKS